jgi:hypothetical protein
MAATAVGKIVAVLPIRACAATTPASVGLITIHRQPMATITEAAMIRQRSGAGDR